MSRKLCLIILSLQIVLFAFIFWVSLTDGFEKHVGPNAGLVFKIISFTFILLFPFGLASLGLSMTFILIWEMNAFPAEFEQKIVEGRSPIMFFVWKEIRERSNVYGLRKRTSGQESRVRNTLTNRSRYD